MELSVIIPTHKRPGPLKEAILSALTQDGTFEREVLVVDDSAGREGEKVVEAIADPRVSYLAMDEPTGGNPSRVRNTGFARSKGTFIHFLDDDDRVTPGAHQKMIAALSAHPHRGVVFGCIHPFGDDPVAVAREQRVFATSARRSRILSLLGSSFLYAAHQLFVSPTIFVNSACMARRSAVVSVNGYDEELSVMEDVDFYTRAIRASGALFLNEPVIEYRTGAPSLMNASAGASVTAAYQRMYEKYTREHGSLEFRAAQVAAKVLLERL